MYSGNKYLFMLVIDTQKGNNNKHSGGLPHSEIHGSKLILSSPWLIAEYHVFHRLLLPRHSPNALFALDLIQKKSDLRLNDAKLVHGKYGEGKIYSPDRDISIVIVLRDTRIWYFLGLAVTYSPTP